MRIDGDYMFRDLTGTATGSKKETSATDFSQVLQQAVGNESAGAQVGGTGPVVLSHTTANIPLLSKVNTLLEGLEEYSQALGSPEHTLKTLSPLLAGLEEKAQALETSIAKNPGGTLEGIASDVVSQIKAEAIKFNRGDYV